MSTNFRLGQSQMNILSKADMLSNQELKHLKNWSKDIEKLGNAILNEEASVHREMSEGIFHLINEFNNQNKLVAAICMAPAVLARAGVLKDKQATCFASYQDEITKGHGQYIDKPVIVDGNIITASGPKAAQNFGQRIKKYLTVKPI